MCYVLFAVPSDAPQCGSLRYGKYNRGQNARRPLICRLYAALVSHNILFLLHITTCSSPSFYCHSFIYISFVLIKLVVLPPGEDAGLISCRRRWLLVSEVVPREYNPCLDYSLPPPLTDPYVLVYACVPIMQLLNTATHKYSPCLFIPPLTTNAPTHTFKYRDCVPIIHILNTAQHFCQRNRLE